MRGQVRWVHQGAAHSDSPTARPPHWQVYGYRPSAPPTAPLPAGGADHLTSWPPTPRNDGMATRMVATGKVIGGMSAGRRYPWKTACPGHGSQPSQGTQREERRPPLSLSDLQLSDAEDLPGRNENSSD
ncbi:hypothetical protein ACOMHN_053607 [Nucella lapillus]